MILFSCAQKTVQINSQNTTDEVFQDGVYKQDIQVTYTKDGRKESSEFKAILKKSPDEINMYAYVGFGIVLFKLKDDLKNPIQFSTTEPRIEKNKEFFLKMYPLIKEIILMKKADKRLKSDSFTLTMDPEKFPVHVDFFDRENQGPPRWLTLENQEHFKFTITTSDFEKLRGK